MAGHGVRLQAAAAAVAGAAAVAPGHLSAALVLTSLGPAFLRGL